VDLDALLAAGIEETEEYQDAMDRLRSVQAETTARCRRIDVGLAEALKRITGPRTPEQQREYDEQEETRRFISKGYADEP